MSPSDAATLVESLRSWRDRAIAGLMLWCGLRSMEVLGLNVKDVDIGGRWVTVTGKGAKQRRVPLDTDVASVIDVYLLAERPESASDRLFLVAKGSNRGGPLTPAGLRTVFRYHREITGVRDGHPHALRHTFGTVLAEAGVDLAVWAASPLEERLSVGSATRPIITFLMLHQGLCPGYDYLLARKLSPIWREIQTSPLKAHIDRFLDEAESLGFTDAPDWALGRRFRRGC
ncbi:tyrosine-type recombinase/integrase [Arthrobacter subterraneus]|uniref:tyrosine-type recombinase/integrase n=1 Tax=Arthrobacter subterraneus TaxID=335973 RepID=UPI0037FF292D